MNTNTRRVGILFAEALGTFMLAMVALSASQLGLPIFTGAAVGFALSLIVVTLGGFSGAHVNPAVTIGVLSLRKISALRAAAQIAAQFVGGFSAWRFHEYLTGTTASKRGMLEWTAKFDWSNVTDRRMFFAELVGAVVFGFGIAAVLYQKFDGVKAGSTIGSSLFVGVMIASLASNALLNPALAYGVRSWTLGYLAAPIIGHVLGMNLYALFFVENWLPNLNGILTSGSKSKKK